VLAFGGEVVSGYARIWLVGEQVMDDFGGTYGVWVILFSFDCACRLVNARGTNICYLLLGSV